jgi:hypothetical protein
MEFDVVKGLNVPQGRSPHPGRLRELIQLAKKLEVGSAVLLRLSEAQTFRIILTTLGWQCVTDSRTSPDPIRILCFKLDPDAPLPTPVEPPPEGIRCVLPVPNLPPITAG